MAAGNFKYPLPSMKSKALMPLHEWRRLWKLACGSEHQYNEEVIGLLHCGLDVSADEAFHMIEQLCLYLDIANQQDKHGFNPIAQKAWDMLCLTLFNDPQSYSKWEQYFGRERWDVRNPLYEKLVWFFDPLRVIDGVATENTNIKSIHKPGHKNEQAKRFVCDRLLPNLWLYENRDVRVVCRILSALKDEASPFLRGFYDYHGFLDPQFSKTLSEEEYEIFEHHAKGTDSSVEEAYIVSLSAFAREFILLRARRQAYHDAEIHKCGSQVEKEQETHYLLGFEA